jgi:hypothetical protein
MIEVISRKAYNPTNAGVNIASNTLTCFSARLGLLPRTGRMAWQRDSGYNERARIEGQFARWKQVIGDGLRFHSDQARATEVAIAAQVLNRMLDLGCPNSVRVA